MNGARALTAALEQLGVRHVFGLPGTQNIELFEALRVSSLRTVLATSELAAGFMANGYYRASGKVGVLTTIPGPGFAFAIPAIAEASQDSAALLYITGQPARGPGKQFNLQAIDQRAMLAPLVRKAFDVERPGDIVPAVHAAYAAATEGEPGPVLLQIAASAITAEADAPAEPAEAALPPRPPDPALVERTLSTLAKSRRPVLFVGQGANVAPALLRQLAEAVGAPVIATRSGRGVLSEQHELVIPFDYSPAAIDSLNGLFDRSDAILAIGCKLTHNGTWGFRLRLGPEKLIHIDASDAVLNQNYPAHIAIHADAGKFLEALLLAAGGTLQRSAWPSGEIEQVRQACAAISAPEPKVSGAAPDTAQSFFRALRETLSPRIPAW